MKSEYTSKSIYPDEVYLTHKARYTWHQIIVEVGIVETVGGGERFGHHVGAKIGIAVKKKREIHDKHQNCK
jgi:hypothetical protein